MLTDSEDRTAGPPRRPRGRGCRTLRSWREALAPTTLRWICPGRGEPTPDRKVKLAAEIVRGVYREQHCIYRLIVSRAHTRIVEKDMSD